MLSVRLSQNGVFLMFFYRISKMIWLDGMKLVGYIREKEAINYSQNRDF